MKQQPIWTVAMNPSIDPGVVTDRVIADRKLRCGALRRDPGGGGVNVARVVRRLGGETVAAYPCGGASGKPLDRSLAAEDVERLAEQVGRSREPQATFVHESSIEGESP